MWWLMACLWISDDDFAAWQDRDGDQLPWPADCDDDDPAIPGPAETCDDGVDSTCGGACETLTLTMSKKVTVREATDYDGDGVAELLLTDADLRDLTINRLEGEVLVEVARLEHETGDIAEVLGDVDGDGKDDVGLWDGTIWFGGGLDTLEVDALDVRPGPDLDGDGLRDAALRDFTEVTLVSLATGGPEELTRLSDGGWYFGMDEPLRWADLDGDGSPEVIGFTGDLFAIKTPRAPIWNAEGDPLTLFEAEQWVDIVAGDLDGDGYGDLVVAQDDTMLWVPGAAAWTADVEASTPWEAPYWDQTFGFELFDPRLGLVQDIDDDGVADLARWQQGQVVVVKGPMSFEEYLEPTAPDVIWPTTLEEGDLAVSTVTDRGPSLIVDSDGALLIASLPAL